MADEFSDSLAQWTHRHGPKLPVSWKVFKGGEKRLDQTHTILPKREQGVICVALNSMVVLEAADGVSMAGISWL